MKTPRRAIRICAAASLIAVLGSQALATEPAAECGGKRIEAVAAEAIDATSLRLADGTELKFESVIGPSAGDGDEAAETRARAALKQLTGGRKLTIFAAEGKDRYGRIPARAVLVDEKIWLEAALSEQGFVRILPRANEACVKALLAAEQKARVAGAGLWAQKKFRVLAAADIPALTEALGRFVIVEGTIRRVGESKARLYLDFGRRFTEDFTIVVPNAARNALAAKGSDPKNWRGKRVRVRGVLISWGGPAIEINAVAAIELLDSEIPEKSE
jgi:endonuclease YncB( thermonuclease family)